MFTNLPRRLAPGRNARRKKRSIIVEALEGRQLLAAAPQIYTVTNLNDSGAGSLRDAIAIANADSYSRSAFDTIRFDPSLAGQTIDLTTTGDSTDSGFSALAITAPIVIDGSTAPGMTIARSPTVGTPDMRLFYVGVAGKLTLNDLTIIGGQDYSGDGGGGILNFGDVTLTGDTFIDNTSTGDGGALDSGSYPNGSTSTLTNDTFMFNFAYGNGGGVFLNPFETAILTNDVFTGNFAVNGAGLGTEFGSTTLTGDTFTSNSATNNGGGIYSVGAILSSTNDTFTRNSATNGGDGGGILNDGAATLVGDKLIDNSAFDGGGIASEPPTGPGTPLVPTGSPLKVMMTDDTFTGNSTIGKISGGPVNPGGGGLFNGADSTVVSTGDTFNGNSSDSDGLVSGPDDGGGLENNGQATLTYDTFTGNSAADGGGFDNVDGMATLTSDTFTGNSVGLAGGGVFIFGGTVTLSADTFTSNSAGGGGGLYDQDDIINGPVAKVTLANDTFTDNSGSGLFNVCEHLTLTNDTFTGNTSTVGGSGIYNDDIVPLTLYNTIVAGNYIAGASYSTMPSEIFGTVTGSNNLIGDPGSAGGLTDGSDGNIVGGSGLPIPLSTIFATDANGVPALASYGGPTQTVALVPGSPAIDAGSMSVPNFQFIDQRGFPREGAPDIGAFESQGFHLTISGGNGQSAPVGQAFASLLTVTVTPINPIEPVNGGGIFFLAPVTGPSALLSGHSRVPIGGGMALVAAAANGDTGSYAVTASVPESNVVDFNLTNVAFTPASVQAEITAAGPNGITLQPTTLTPLNLILTTLDGLGPQASTSKVTVSLPSTMSPYQAIKVDLPAGLDFTLDGNGSSVNGDVAIRQNSGGDNPTVNNLNVTGDLRIRLGNADNGSVVVTQSKVSGNVEIRLGKGDADSVTVSGLSVGGDAKLETGSGNADRISISGLTIGRCSNAQIETGNGKGDAISADALVVGGDLRIETGDGDGDSVAVTAISGPTTISGDTEIELGNGDGDTATVNGSNGATFSGCFALQMGNGGNTVNVGTVAGAVTFGGTVRVSLGNGTNTLNLAATITQSGGVPGSQVYFKKQAVFEGRAGKNRKYLGVSGVNLFGSPQFNNFG